MVAHHVLIFLVEEIVYLVELYSEGGASACSWWSMSTKMLLVHIYMWVGSLQLI